MDRGDNKWQRNRRTVNQASNYYQEDRWQRNQFAESFQRNPGSEFCADVLEDCKDAKCLKRHRNTVRFDIAVKTTTLLGEDMKWNIGKALRRIDYEIGKRRRYLIELSEQKDRNLSKEDVVTKDVFVLIKQRIAFCSRAYETLYVRLHRYDIISIIWRDLYRLNCRLPALAKRLELEAAIRSNDFVMVVGATGSGKSTQIPQYVLDMPEYFGKKVICTQPRRVATVSLARRVAGEYAGGDIRRGKLGHEVGFRIGGLSRRCRHTCLEYMTEGMLLQALAEKLSRNDQTQGQMAEENDRISLKSVAAVIVDEVHERNILSDFIVGLLKAKQRESYPHLKVIVSSATIDNEKFSKYLGNCPIVQIPGKMFPVEIKYCKNTIFDDDFLHFANRERLISLTVEKAIEVTLETPHNSGHILCFLTGQVELESARNLFLDILEAEGSEFFNSIDAHVLCGRMTPDDQQKVVEPCGPGKRKVIFSTDVAETSITIEAVAYVIDCGYAKDVMYDPKKNVTALKTFPISKSSADQRAGRAGRTRPGVCYRLYTKQFYEAMQAFPKPEIQRKSLSLTVATLMATGQDPKSFEWIDPPLDSAIEAALKELRLLGLITEKGDNVTEVGRAISCLQIDPGLGRMIFYACREGFGEAAAMLAALMMISFQVFSKKKSKYWSPKGELVSCYRAFCDWLDLKRIDDDEMKATKGQAAKSEEKPENKVDDGHESDTEEKEVGSEEDDSGDESDEDYEMFVPKELDRNEVDDDDDVLLHDTLPTSERIRQWAEANNCSSDACYMANLERISLVNRLQIRGLWQLAPVQSRTPTDEELQQLILCALAMKTAKIFTNWFYRIVTTKSFGEVSPSSFLRKVCTSAPVWVAFQEATSRGGEPSLQKVTPIDPAWFNLNASSLCSLPSQLRETLLAHGSQLTSTV